MVFFGDKKGVRLMFLATSGLRFKKVQVDSVGLQGLSGLHFSGLHGPTGDPEWIILIFITGLGTYWAWALIFIGLGHLGCCHKQIKKKRKKITL